MNKKMNKSIVFTSYQEYLNEYFPSNLNVLDETTRDPYTVGELAAEAALSISAKKSKKGELK